MFRKKVSFMVVALTAVTFGYATSLSIAQNPSWGALGKGSHDSGQHDTDSRRVGRHFGGLRGLYGSVSKKQGLCVVLLPGH